MWNGVLCTIAAGATFGIEKKPGIEIPVRQRYIPMASKLLSGSYLLQVYTPMAAKSLYGSANGSDRGITILIP